MEGDFIESIDDAWPRCAPSATLSHLCFLFDLHHKDRVFVVSGGGRLGGARGRVRRLDSALAAKMPDHRRLRTRCATRRRRTGGAARGGPRLGGSASKFSYWAHKHIAAVDGASATSSPPAAVALAPRRTPRLGFGPPAKQGAPRSVIVK